MSATDGQPDGVPTLSMTIPGTSCHPSSRTVVLSGRVVAAGGGPAIPDPTLEARESVAGRSGRPDRRGRRGRLRGGRGTGGTGHQVGLRDPLGQSGWGHAAGGGRGDRRGGGLPALVSRGRPGGLLRAGLLLLLLLLLLRRPADRAAAAAEPVRLDRLEDGQPVLGAKLGGRDDHLVRGRPGIPAESAGSTQSPS